LGTKNFGQGDFSGNGVPHKDKKVYVIIKTKHGNVDHAEYSSNVVELVKSLKHQSGKDIYCDSSADIVYELLNHRLFDRIIISVIPHLLGDGIRL